MSKFKIYKLDEILTFKYGKDQKKVVDEKGKYPILGTGGQMGWTNSFLYNKPSVLIGRKGTINNPFYIDTPFWTIDTLFYTEIDEEKVFPKYLFYKFKLINFLRYNEATGVPSLKTDTLNRIPVTIHEDLPTQQKIASVLSDLDAKIALNNRINAELEAMAKTLYDYWFVQFDFPSPPTGGTEGGLPYKTSGGVMVWNEELKREIPEGWEIKDLANVIEIKYGKDHKNLASGLIPVFGSGGIMRYVNQAIYDKESILIPRKGTLSNLFYLNEPFWSVDTMFFSKMKIAHIGKFLFYFLQSLNLASLNAGTAVPSLTTEILNQLKILTPSPNILKRFDSILTPMFEMKEQATKENQQLATLRDWLLPMLMNGQVGVE